VTTGKLSGQFKVPLSPLAFASDGKSLIGGDNRGLLVQWEVPTGKELRQFSQPPVEARMTRYTTSIACSADGRLVAATMAVSRFDNFYHTRLVKVWDAAGKELWDVEQETDTNMGGGLLAFAPNSKALLCVDGRAGTLYEATTGKEIRRYGAKGDEAVWSTAFAPDGKLVGTRRMEGLSLSLRFWETDSGKERPMALGESVLVRGSFGFMFENRCPSFAFAADGRTIAATDGHALRLWEVTTGKEVTPVAGHHQGITGLGLATDGRTLTTMDEGVVRRWEATTGKELSRIALVKPGSDAGRLALTPDGRLAARIASGEGVIQLWDVAAAKEIHTLQLGVSNSHCLAFSPDGTCLAGNTGGPIYVWEVASGKELARFNEHAKPEMLMATCLALSTDNTLLASVRFGSELGQVGMPSPAKSVVRLWSLGLAKQLAQFETAQQIMEFIFSPTGRTAAVVYGNKSVGIWELATGKERYRFPVAARCLAFAPDGQTLAVGCLDQTVRLVDSFTGKEFARFQGHQGYVRALAFSNDGKTLVSGGSDTVALIWDVPSRTHQKPAAELTPEQLAALGTDLVDADATKAFRAMQTLARGHQAVSWIGEQVKPALAVEARRIEQLVADLGANDFAVRQKAADELEKLGELAGPTLRKALEGKPSLETRQRIDKLLGMMTTLELTPPQRRAVRAVEVLEQVNTGEARELLERLAKGALGARLTREAQAALDRLSRRSMR
jgi:WD40 repeat protein